MASLAEIQEFLGAKRIAIAGVSRNPQDFTRMLFREFRDRGYDVVPVNPNLAEVDGIPCVVAHCRYRPAGRSRAAPDQAGHERRSRSRLRTGGHPPYLDVPRDARKPAPEGVSLIAGECPFMFLSKPHGIHRLHGFCRKLVGSLSEIGALRPSRNFVTRPTSTHSTTKMLPAWSKQAPCGQTNLPGVKWSRVRARVFRHSLRRVVAQLLDHLVVAIQQGDARAQVGHHAVAVAEVVEVARQVGAGDEIDVLAVEREALDAVVGAVGHGQDRGLARAYP